MSTRAGRTSRETKRATRIDERDERDERRSSESAVPDPGSVFPEGRRDAGSREGSVAGRRTGEDPARASGAGVSGPRDARGGSAASGVGGPGRLARRRRGNRKRARAATRARQQHAG